MSKVRFISDLHFNHENAAKRRGFASAAEMNEKIINSWNAIVNKKDVTYILGDVTMEKKEGYSLLDKLNGIKHVILGNHDRRQDVHELLKYVNSVAGAINYKKKYMLTHIPIYSGELKFRFSVNIHGHVHENTIMAYRWNHETQSEYEIAHPNYFNVSAEVIDYIPISLEEIETEIKKRHV